MHMKRNNVIGISFIIFTVLCGTIAICPSSIVYTQPSEEWSKKIGGWDWDIGYFVEQTNDGGYIIVGYTESFGAGAEDVYLVKTNANGRELWRKTFGGSDEDYGYSVQQTTDGGYIIVGETWSFGEGECDVYLIKTDSKGNEQWSKTFGGSDEDYGFSVQQTTDGGYIIVGETWSFGEVECDVYLIKTDSDGNKGWSKYVGGSGYEVSYSVQQTTDGGYIIFGYTDSFSEEDFDAYLVKTDSEGEIIWDETYGGSGDDEFIFGQQTTDGGYIMVGDTEIIGSDVNDVYLVKTDSEGNELWSNTFGGQKDDFGHSIQETTDGGYIIVGDTDSFGEEDWDVYLIKTDSEGNELWSNTFGGSDDDTGWCVKQTTDGGYIIAGETWDDNKDDVAVYLIKLAPESEQTPSQTPSPTPTEEKGRCIIATATYGSELSPEVQFLRGFRDNYVLNTYAGKNFMKAFDTWYYSFSPEVASVIAANNAIRGIMKILLYPLIGILHITATTYSLLSLFHEFAIVVSGLIASSLLGVIYIAPLALIIYIIKKVKVHPRTLRVGSIIWGLSIGGIVFAEITRWSTVMMFSTVLFVLTTMILATLSSVKYMTRHIQH
jgi:hypothetical protein